MTPAWRDKLRALGISDEDLRRWQTAVGAKPDADPGPLTFALTVETLAARGLMVRDRETADDKAEAFRGTRLDVVAWARGELGDRDPQKYIRDVAHVYIGQPPNAKAWCGIFWLWCLFKAELTKQQWIDGKGFAGVLGLPRVQIPEPGDGMYFGTPNHHYAVVERVRDGVVHTIEGNTLRTPREGVTAQSHPLSAVNAGGGCYFSIAPLLRTP
jgi:hypothetical protein